MKACQGLGCSTVPTALNDQFQRHNHGVTFYKGREPGKISKIPTIEWQIILMHKNLQET